MKFFNLLKKELKELITLNTVIEMLVVLAMLFIMGNVMSTVVNDIMKTTEINVCDLDKTDFTKNILDNLENTKINYVDVNSDDRTKVMAELEIDSLIIIPKGFSDKILVDKKQSDLEVINVMHNSSMMGSMDSTKIDDAVEKIQDAASKSLLSGNYEMNDETIATVKAPVLVKPVTVIGEKSANVSSGMLASVSAAQGMIVPIIIFILIIFTSQMIISSISTEKIDKTLETLLSAPVSRGAVIGSKMLSATIVALLNAVVYMFGFSGFLGGITGTMSGSADLAGGANSAAQSLPEALAALGLQLQPTDFVLVGIQMFLTIMIALLVSLMLGAMATDMKSAQTVLMPIMICAMIPYIISLFTSINSLPFVIKGIMFLIPFTHTFTAIDNILFGNMAMYWGGLAYQLVFFVVCMYLSVKLFSSDKLFTISLNFGQKAKAKKALKAANNL